MSFLNDVVLKNQLHKFIKFPDLKETKKSKEYTNIINNQIKGSSIELRLGNEVYLSGDKEFNKLDSQTTVKVSPGNFAILLTYETVYVPPEYMAFLSIRRKFKDMGLVNISGFHVDPGFKGKITFSVYNAGPSDIYLRHRESIFIIFYADLSSETTMPRKKPGDDPEITNITAESMNQLSGRSVSPHDLDKRMNKLELITNIQWSLIAAIIIGILLTMIKQ